MTSQKYITHLREINIDFMKHFIQTKSWISSMKPGWKFVH